MLKMLNQEPSTNSNSTNEAPVQGISWIGKDNYKWQYITRAEFIIESD